MDQDTLVTSQIEDGWQMLRQFADDGNSIEAGFWVKMAESGMWFLYISTPLVDRVGPAATYRAIRASVTKVTDCSVDMSEVKAISPTNPMAREVSSLMARHGRRLVPRYGAQTLGSVEVEQLIVYPAHAFTAKGPPSETGELPTR